jgi:basic membrane lipoprotein Med (substrate-binding protein (PBP1-ABC) superfamily)
VTASRYNRQQPAFWRRYALLLAAAVAAVVVAILVFVTTREDGNPAPDPRARQYRDFTACLLTDDKGIAGAAAAPVWAGMQDASGSTRAKVQYVPVMGAQTPQNAAPFLNGLAQGRCQVILAVGPAATGAVGDAAKRFPKSQFAVVNGKASGGNVSSVDGSPPDAVRPAVRDFVERKAREAAAPR